MTKRQAVICLLMMFSGALVLLFAGHWLSRTPGGIRILAAKLKGGTILDTTGVEFQKRQNDCGPACLRMVAKAHGVNLPWDRDPRDLKRSMADLARTCKQAGLRAKAWRLRTEDLNQARKPLVAFVSGNHFVVVDEASKERVIIRDPALGRIAYRPEIFNRMWRGEVLFIEPPGIQDSESFGPSLSR